MFRDLFRVSPDLLKCSEICSEFPLTYWNVPRSVPSFPWPTEMFRDQFRAALIQRWDLPAFMCQFCPFVQIVSVGGFRFSTLAQYHNSTTLQGQSCMTAQQNNCRSTYSCTRTQSTTVLTILAQRQNCMEAQQHNNLQMFNSTRLIEINKFRVNPDISATSSVTIFGNPVRLWARWNY
jgi:hypothetical protein